MKSNWEKDFDEKFPDVHKNINEGGFDCEGEDISVEVKDFIRQTREQAKQEGIEEAIELSDEIEAGKETTFEEWKAFKCFRNTLGDRIELKKKEGKNEKTNNSKF